MSKRAIIVLTAPSGAGKTTIAHRVLQAHDTLRFSVSATTREARPNETDGEDYHFMSAAAFQNQIEAGKLLEYEEVYPGQFYGTLKQEVDRSSPDAPVLLDIDVRGAANVKEIYGSEALVIFIAPPSFEVLKQRLTGRGTEDDASVQSRLQRARMEMTRSDDFDAIVVNDDLDVAVEETLAHINRFLSS
ncbi:MAG: guanylate kinase [Longimonas sp.]|uniref:guanylate kinase n=1 Tax=Longimonas sp. TaxID=2039626 RepID=UPI003359EFD5